MSEGRNAGVRGYALPDEPKQAFDLYRALCNVRMPSGDSGHTLPEDFYTVQSEVLKNITEEKGITESAPLHRMRGISFLCARRAALICRGRRRSLIRIVVCTAETAYQSVLPGQYQK